MAGFQAGRAEVVGEGQSVATCKLPVLTLKQAVLTVSTKINVISGPMDAFIKRELHKAESNEKLTSRPGGQSSKIAKATHSHRPVGSVDALSCSPSDVVLFGASKEAGPSRLGRQPADPSSNIRGSSKYFSGKRLTAKQELDAEVQVQAQRMVWEDSDEEGPDVNFSQTPIKRVKLDSTTSQLDLDIGVSSPPHPASIQSTPSPPSQRSLPSSTGVLSLAAPSLSSPVVSSPADSYTADPFSPPMKRRGRMTTPSSPTHSTGGPGDDELVAETQVDDIRPTFITRAPVLIPASSPNLTMANSSHVSMLTATKQRHVQVHKDLSSDSIEEEELRTPSAEILGKQKLGGGAVVETPSPGKEKAEVIGGGWRAKFAFSANTVRFHDQFRI